MRTKIISEIGENHLGDMNIAKKMIQLSKEAGADYAKFQLYDPDRTHKDDPERDWFFRVALPRDKMTELVEECNAVGIKPLFTSWDTTRAQWCLDEGILEIKLASFHVTDKKLLGFINERFKTVYLSTGMSTIEDIKSAVNLLDKVKTLYLLHCVSDYPARHEDVNLKTMDLLRQFSEHVGYSDHTMDRTAILAAVAKGAEAVEVHFTLSKDMPGTDHIFSVAPDEFKNMVSEIRKIEKILGTDKKVMTSSESENQKFLRERFTY